MWGCEFLFLIFQESPFIQANVCGCGSPKSLMGVNTRAPVYGYPRYPPAPLSGALHSGERDNNKLPS